MNPPTPFHVRLVVPVRDERTSFVRFISELVDEAPSSCAADVVVVDDGSAAAARAMHAAAVDAAAARLAARGAPHRVRLVSTGENRGKGAAIRLGWGDGTGAAWLGFADGDGAAPAREVWRLASALAPDAPFDALLAARVRGGGRTVRRAALRSIQGAVFARLARAVLDLQARDPQCGLKFFRAEALVPVLPALEEARWMLDAELLLQLRNLGARFVEAPIDWTELGGSGVVFLLDPLRMALGLWALRRRVGVVRHPAARAGGSAPSPAEPVRRAAR